MLVVAHPDRLSVDPNAFPTSVAVALGAVSQSMREGAASEAVMSLYDRLEGADDILLRRFGFRRHGDTWVPVAVQDLLGRVKLEQGVVLAALDTALRDLSAAGYLKLSIHETSYTQFKYLMTPVPTNREEPLQLYAPGSLHRAIAKAAADLGYTLTW